MAYPVSGKSGAWLAPARGAQRIPASALACRQMAAAAATFTTLPARLGDTHRPGCARAARVSPTPCPSWPMTQAHGNGGGDSCRKRPWCELVTTSGTASASSAEGSRRFDQVQPEMGAHAGAQHFGRPQRGRAPQRNDLSESERGGAAQDGADIAGVLNPVEHHGGGLWQQRGPPAARATRRPAVRATPAG
jgi:hypothetical protein